jgi:hypothetical protein
MAETSTQVDATGNGERKTEARRMETNSRERRERNATDRYRRIAIENRQTDAYI